MRVVIDSGIWISALRFGGIPYLAVKKALEFDQVVICEQIVMEVRRTFADKFSEYQEKADALLAGYLRRTLHVSLTGAVRGICRDPDDDMVLEAALHSNADRILTGDFDLLSLGRFHTARIVTARAYLEEFMNQHPLPISF